MGVVTRYRARWSAAYLMERKTDTTRRLSGTPKMFMMTDRWLRDAGER
jgi:hypothetical protein